jgi:hypothetical protein
MYFRHKSSPADDRKTADHHLIVETWTLPVSLLSGKEWQQLEPDHDAQNHEIQQHDIASLLHTRMP